MTCVVHTNNPSTLKSSVIWMIEMKSDMPNHPILPKEVSLSYERGDHQISIKWDAWQGKSYNPAHGCLRIRSSNSRLEPAGILKQVRELQRSCQASSFRSVVSIRSHWSLLFMMGLLSVCCGIFIYIPKRETRLFRRKTLIAFWRSSSNPLERLKEALSLLRRRTEEEKRLYLSIHQPWGVRQLNAIVGFSEYCWGEYMKEEENPVAGRWTVPSYIESGGQWNLIYPVWNRLNRF